MPERVKMFYSFLSAVLKLASEYPAPDSWVGPPVANGPVTERRLGIAHTLNHTASLSSLRANIASQRTACVASDPMALSAPVWGTGGPEFKSRRISTTG